MPLLRCMLAPACSPYASAQRQLPFPITAAQWQSVSEMTTYDRGQELPRYPWNAPQSAPAGAVNAHASMQAIDDIEED